MPGELGGGDLDAPGRPGLEGDADGPVEGDPPGGLDPVEHRLAQQVVGEPGPRRRRDEDAGVESGPRRGLDLDRRALLGGGDDV